MISLTDETGTAFDIDAERITSVSGQGDRTVITIDYVENIAVNENFLEVIGLLAASLTLGGGANAV